MYIQYVEKPAGFTILSWHMKFFFLEKITEERLINKK